MGSSKLFMDSHKNIGNGGMVKVSKASKKLLLQFNIDMELINKFCKKAQVKKDNFYIRPDAMINSLVYWDKVFYYSFFIFTDMVLEDGDFGELTRFKYQYKRVHKFFENGDIEEVIWANDKPVRLKLFRMYKYLIPKEKQYEIFLEIYRGSEYGFDLKDVGILLEGKNTEEIVAQIKESGYESEDGYFTIYRGEASGSTPYQEALSWTLKRDTAIFFRDRFNTDVRKLYTARVHQDNILAFLDGRNEYEVLVQEGDLIDVEEI